jgi:GGDEF domain-containing protein
MSINTRSTIEYKLLKQFSERVQNCLRESDTIARQGGDSFPFFYQKLKKSKMFYLLLNEFWQLFKNRGLLKIMNFKQHPV